MIRKYTISIFTENFFGLLNRITIIFTRRRINIESLTVSESEIKGVHRYTVVIKSEDEKVRKLVKQIEKLVDVIKAFYHVNEETVFQEVALYKVSMEALKEGRTFERLIRDHHARLLTVEADFVVIEKTGHKEETQDLLRMQLTDRQSCVRAQSAVLPRWRSTCRRSDDRRPASRSVDSD